MQSQARAVATAGLVLLLAAPPTHAQPSKTQLRCMRKIAGAGGQFVRTRLHVLQRCADDELEDASCASPDLGALAKQEEKLRGALAKHCAFDGTPGTQAANLAALGFPGPCRDADPGNGFTASDLQDCLVASHAAIAVRALALQYDDGLVGPLDPDALGCQKAIGRQGRALVACVLKKVQKCRYAVLAGKLVGIEPDRCALDHSPTADAVGECLAKARGKMRDACSQDEIDALAVCTPDQAERTAAIDCVSAGLRDLTDGPALDVPPDLIDYEYATRGGFCGDGVVQSPDEECDGADDDACPGQCGSTTPLDGLFACLCLTAPRAALIEHYDADIDEGWSGRGHDGGVAEGGGFALTLHDCDGAGLCNAGPTCALPPHVSCAVPATAAPGATGDAICAQLAQGTCRKDRSAVGPHCARQIQAKCDPTLPDDPVCDLPGDFCVRTFSAPPVPSSAAGVGLCTVSAFTEDVAGTVNVLTGASAVRHRTQAVVHLGASTSAPCPVCGGFCNASRTLCTTNADCGLGEYCVDEAVCSSGPMQDQPCRQQAIGVGGPTEYFGVTSVDCPPPPASALSTEGVDVLSSPRTTGTLVVAPSVPCASPAFAGDVCAGGANDGRACSVASQCPGGACGPQCFCPGQGAPNDCVSACSGGGNEAAPCATDSECPGGFCHPADCRRDPADFDSSHEGRCTAGPIDGRCALTPYVSCTADADCAPPTCPTCPLGDFCAFAERACFLNAGIVREGAPGVPDQVVVGAQCLPATTNFVVDATRGLPGPRAVTQPQTMVLFP